MSNPLNFRYKKIKQIQLLRYSKFSKSVILLILIFYYTFTITIYLVFTYVHLSGKVITNPIII